MLAISWPRFFIALGLLLSISTQANAQGEPAEVSRLSNALDAISGVTKVNIGKIYLPDIAVSDLSLPGLYADLPIASLRRSNGGLPDELLLSMDFSITRDEKGLKALEFLAWWVRDQSRGGENMQLRAIGLPPMAGETVQLGKTLRFTIDWFYENPSQNIDKVLEAIGEVGISLENSARLYRKSFN